MQEQTPRAFGVKLGAVTTGGKSTSNCGVELVSATTQTDVSYP